MAKNIFTKKTNSGQEQTKEVIKPIEPVSLWKVIGQEEDRMQTKAMATPNGVIVNYNGTSVYVPGAIIKKNTTTKNFELV